jgi:hypothetical protein
MPNDELKTDTPVAAVGVPVDALIEEWFAKHFHGLGIQLSEFLYNHLHAAKEDLKEILSRASL